MTQCNDCGAEIEFLKSWRGQWVIIEPNPSEDARATFYEPSIGEFVTVFRHVCLVKAEKKARPKL